MVSVAEAALHLSIFILLLIVCKYEVQQITSPNQSINRTHHEMFLIKASEISWIT